MFDQLKPLMRNGERYIIVEAGKPEYVLMRFQDYVELAGANRINPGHANPGEHNEEWRSVNTVLEEVRSREPSFAPEITTAPEFRPAPDPSTIRLEDLPL